MITPEVNLNNNNNNNMLNKTAAEGPASPSGLRNRHFT
jgi:hypothetical protein